MSENTKSQKISTEGEGGKKKTGIIVLLVIILILIGIIIFLLISKNKEENKEQRNVVVNQDNVQEVIDQMDAKIEEPTPLGYYTVTMSYDWHFESGDAVSPDAYIKNSEVNSTPVYVDVFLADDLDNPIYKSPVIPLGAELTNVVLDEDLEPGKYDCVAVYNMIDEEQNVLDRLRVTVTITING